MFDFLENYDYLIIPYLSQILRAVLIPFATLGFVYISGRLLEITKTDKARNIFATIMILILSFATGKFDGNLANMLSFPYIFNSLIYAAISAIIYINLCWRLSSRIDRLLDKRVGSDEDYEKERLAAEKKRLDAIKKRKADKLKRKLAKKKKDK
ncbi:MAG: hypothetical protein DRJ01_05840 [Bacteroidetes bacterium]|nr:MAG: hypothetical protein DRJ01_05840 [Bacteroidota bacterium]